MGKDSNESKNKRTDSTSEGRRIAVSNEFQAGDRAEHDQGGLLQEVGQELLHEYAHVGKRRALVSPGRGSLIIRFAVNQHPQLCALPLGKPSHLSDMRPRTCNCTVLLTVLKVSRAQFILCAQKLPTQFISMSTLVPSIWCPGPFC